MEGLTSPAKELSTGSGSTIHPTAWKRNSRKFAVANGSPTHRQALDNRLCRTRLASKCGNFAPFVAPMCIKGLRLVTMLLPREILAYRTGDQPKFAYSGFCEVRFEPEQRGCLLRVLKVQDSTRP
jgi:hypothetical protein